MQPWLYFIILVMPPHNFWLIYPLFTAFHTAVICMAWQVHALWPEAGTGHLDHKLKTSRSQNVTAVSSLALCPGSLWRPGAKGWQGVGAQRCTNLSPAALWPVWDPGSSWRCHLSSAWWCAAPTEPVWRHISVDGLQLPGGWRELNHCCWLSAISWNFCPFSMDHLRRASLWGWSD